MQQSVRPCRYAIVAEVFFANAVQLGYRPAIPKSLAPEVPQGYVALIEKCWAQDPVDRPAVAVVRACQQQRFIARSLF